MNLGLFLLQNRLLCLSSLQVSSYPIIRFNPLWIVEKENTVVAKTATKTNISTQYKPV
ncbi:hypothetical protein WN48_06597 [Eufriesea mexicana]|uniref:Uncharacterized protein n=1 Tax=Eufriesea mexicana TaxID=516756 RepID=A0A310SJJ7_9HYME|nr:hypothetical protein WN48_06597 [Eufriesea mexicana]